MKRFNYTKKWAIPFLISFGLIIGCKNHQYNDLLNVLILIGKSNHEWQKTTPILIKMYEDAGLFRVNTTNSPDTLTYKDLSEYDVIVSNWNTWPDNNLRMTMEWENDFLKYIKEGGGLVSIHAGASSFYDWNEYHQIGIGRWGKETNHGKQTRAKIYGFDQTHPITQGIKEFFIIDEIWEKPDIYPEAIALASVSAINEKDGHPINESVVFVNYLEKGRSFFTTLGHDEKALLNTGLKTLILRGTQWAANQKVTIKTPADLRIKNTIQVSNYSWNQSDTTFSLRNNSDIVWQYNFNNRLGKPYFHPVLAENSTLTCVSPPDHPWHLGLWFSWKFINGINYWEYLDDFKTDKTGYRSAGITDLHSISIIRNPDYSANIKMELQYHQAEEDVILTENRNLNISAPFPDGSYYIDYENTFSSRIDEVVLDRTPIEGEPEGMSWGGYAGLSIRFSQDLTSPEIIVPDETGNRKKQNWLHMGFNTLNGESAGLCILQNPEFTTPSSSWYLINNPDIPFYYFSPAVLYDGKIILKKDDVLRLKYRVWVFAGKTGKEEIESKYKEYLNF
jgi:type 1 glutamine amidotransferase